MAFIVLKGSKERLLVETVDRVAKVYSLKPGNSKSVQELLRKNENQIIQGLFTSDCETRRNKEIGADLGVDAQTVADMKYRISQGRKMSESKLELLKKIYSIDNLIR